MKINGVEYNVVVSGEGPPLVLLHGFTGSTATWKTLVEATRPHFTTIAIDLLGHGRSEIHDDPERYRMENLSADLFAILDALGHDRAAAIGYSLGGRLLLYSACARPERFRAIILEGASPGIADEGRRHEQRRGDEALADAIEAGGVAKFVEEWEQKPEFRAQPPSLRAYLHEERLKNSARGLANMIRAAGPGAQAPQHALLGRLSLPVLLVIGEHDATFRPLAEEIAAGAPDARLEVVPAARHVVHLEEPEAFHRIALDFLR